MTGPRTAVITVAHGRHRHLLMQECALSGTTPPADFRCLVALDDPASLDVEIQDAVAQAAYV